MPALPALHDATAASPGTLAPRGDDAPNVVTRQPLEHSVPYIPESLNRGSIQPRQQQEAVPGIIPTYYRVDGPSPGTVVGIVLGSVTGFILIAWLIQSLLQGNTGKNGTSGTIAGEEEIVVRRRRNSQSHASRSRRSSRPEVREYSRSPRRSGGRSTVIVEERRAPPRPRSIVVESRRPGDDVVEVIEEHDEYRTRRGSRRGADYRY